MNNMTNKQINQIRLAELKLSVIVDTITKAYEALRDGDEAQLSSSFINAAFTAVKSGDTTSFAEKGGNWLENGIDYRHAIYTMVMRGGERYHIGNQEYFLEEEDRVFDAAYIHIADYCFWGDVDISPEEERAALENPGRPIFYKPITFSENGYRECMESEGPTLVVNEDVAYRATCFEDLAPHLVSYEAYKKWVDPLGLAEYGLAWKYGLADPEFQPLGYKERVAWEAAREAELRKKWEAEMRNSS